MQVGDLLYEVVPCGYRPGTRETRDEPADGPEVDFPLSVSVETLDGDVVGCVPFDTLLLNYASDRGVSLVHAGSNLGSMLLDSIEAHLADLYDDHEGDDYDGCDEYTEPYSDEL